MAFFPLSIFFDFAVCIGLGLVFTRFEGIMPKVIAIFFFLFGLPIALGRQYWIIESAGVLSETTSLPYPTNILFVIIWMHILAMYYSLALIFRIADRDPIGRKLETPK